ncbi:hypothetical protein EVAR_82892_1 [Eumeta japonica]|uniref:Uncharacterized protein n=1 Tax=Eumeta variegata TaxID=151549 RepID=A0A4C1YK58_EUMVA|nr:hypothetical protein EVAR_82892_1 [Eumeta japonica]
MQVNERIGCVTECIQIRRGVVAVISEGNGNQLLDAHSPGLRWRGCIVLLRIFDSRRQHFIIYHHCDFLASKWKTASGKFAVLSSATQPPIQRILERQPVNAAGCRLWTEMREPLVCAISDMDTRLVLQSRRCPTCR